MGEVGVRESGALVVFVLNSRSEVHFRVLRVYRIVFPEAFPISMRVGTTQRVSYDFCANLPKLKVLT